MSRGAAVGGSDQLAGASSWFAKLRTMSSSHGTAAHAAQRVRFDGAALVIQLAAREWLSARRALRRALRALRVYAAPRAKACRRLARRERQAYVLSWQRLAGCAELLRSSRHLHSIADALHGGAEGGAAVRRRYSAHASSTSFFARFRGLAQPKAQQPIHLPPPVDEFEAAVRQRCAAARIARAVRRGCVGQRATARAALRAWSGMTLARATARARGALARRARARLAFARWAGRPAPQLSLDLAVRGGSSQSARGAPASALRQRPASAREPSLRRLDHGQPSDRGVTSDRGVSSGAESARNAGRRRRASGPDGPARGRPSALQRRAAEAPIAAGANGAAADAALQRAPAALASAGSPAAAHTPRRAQSVHRSRTRGPKAPRPLGPASVSVRAVSARDAARSRLQRWPWLPWATTAAPTPGTATGSGSSAAAAARGAAAPAEMDARAGTPPVGAPAPATVAVRSDAGTPRGSSRRRRAGVSRAELLSSVVRSRSAPASRDEGARARASRAAAASAAVEAALCAIEFEDAAGAPTSAECAARAGGQREQAPLRPAAWQAAARALRAAHDGWRARASELAHARAERVRLLREADRICWYRWVREASLERAATRLQAAARARSARARQRHARLAALARACAARRVQRAVRRRARARGAAATRVQAAHTRSLSRALTRQLRRLRALECTAMDAFDAYEHAAAASGLDGTATAGAQIGADSDQRSGADAHDGLLLLSMLSPFDREEQLAETSEYAAFWAAQELYREQAAVCELAASRLARRLYPIRAHLCPPLPCHAGAERASDAAAGAAVRSAGAAATSRAATETDDSAPTDDDGTGARTHAAARTATAGSTMAASLRRLLFGRSEHHVPFQPPRAPRRPPKAGGLPRSRANTPMRDATRARSRTPMSTAPAPAHTRRGLVGGGVLVDGPEGADGAAEIDARNAGSSPLLFLSARPRKSLKSRPTATRGTASGADPAIARAPSAAQTSTTAR
ncbi:hypothetical protein KFE25_009109 [Diacronema lutheri]|uniref:Uncharacterized protein n=1 Tax=Diacronema lutheri TaxID=2081491 RepID=A0A8J5XM67_DIALT|nr:hypothetical protein KFE25_009109 [Diacronema lutheri]